MGQRSLHCDSPACVSSSQMHAYTRLSLSLSLPLFSSFLSSLLRFPLSSVYSKPVCASPRWLTLLQSTQVTHAPLFSPSLLSLSPVNRYLTEWMARENLLEKRSYRLHEHSLRTLSSVRWWWKKRMQGKREREEREGRQEKCEATERLNYCLYCLNWMRGARVNETARKRREIENCSLGSFG